MKEKDTNACMKSKQSETRSEALLPIGAEFKSDFHGVLLNQKHK
jgi:hypothetical protein